MWAFEVFWLKSQISAYTHAHSKIRSSKNIWKCEREIIWKWKITVFWLKIETKSVRIRYETEANCTTFILPIITPTRSGSWMFSCIALKVNASSISNDHYSRFTYKPSILTGRFEILTSWMVQLKNGFTALLFLL